MDWLRLLGAVGIVVGSIAAIILFTCVMIWIADILAKPTPQWVKDGLGIVLVVLALGVYVWVMYDMLGSRDAGSGNPANDLPPADLRDVDLTPTVVPPVYFLYGSASA